MIEFKDVAFQYEQGSSKGKIENINLTIHDGEVVLICGESGCGQTTLTRLITGLIPHYYEGTLTAVSYTHLMRWVGLMNTLKAQVEEILYSELILEN